MKLKYEDVKFVDCHDWDNLVREIYKRPYCLQQQDDCWSRGIIYLTVPDTNWCVCNNEVPEDADTNEMEVSLNTWLQRDPTKPLAGRNGDKQWGIEMWYERNFYPHEQEIANDLYAKGYLDAGTYVINIDW